MSRADLPVKQNWYKRRTYNNGVLGIFEPFVSPDVRCNIWLIYGREKNLLIDSGLGVASLRDFIEEQTQKPLLCAATHTHFDHVGCHHEFETCLVHESEAPILESPDRKNTLIDSYVTREIFDAYPYDGFDPNTYCIQSAIATRFLSDGDVIFLGDREFEVLHLPGHSPGSVGFLERATKTFFSGDAVYDGPLYDDSYHACTEHYIESMKRLLKLNVDVVHGGHYESFGTEKYQQIIKEFIAGKREAGCPIDIKAAKQNHKKAPQQ